MDTETLRRFCSREGRFAAPWSDGAHTYATDGHLMIRVPRIAEVAEGQPVKDAAAMFFGAEPDEWYPLPGALAETVPCPSCGGSGTAIVCPECNGDGEVELSTEWHTYDPQRCESCEGLGAVGRETWEDMKGDGPPPVEPCDYCGGTGTVPNQAAVPIGPRVYSAHLLARLAVLERVELGPKCHSHPTHVRFVGGEGRLMPTDDRR